MRTRWRGLWVAVMLLVGWPGIGAAQTSTSFKFHTGATAVGNGAVMFAANYSTIHVQIEGTFVGTVVFEGKTKDSTAYVLVQCTNRTDQSKSTDTDVPGYWDCPGGAYNFRARVSAYTSGTIIVTGTGTTAVSSRGGGTAQGLDANFDIQNEINGATSAKPLIVWNGTQGFDLLGDPTLGGVIKPRPLGDTPWYIWPNFEGCVKDVENGYTNFLCINPDAFGTGSGTLTFMTGEQLVVSNLGIEFNESDTNPSCSSGKYTIYADTSEAKLKQCQNGTVSDLGSTVTSGIIIKATDESVTSSTTMQDDDELLVALDANTRYAFDALITYDAPAAGDIKMQFTVPAGATGRRFVHYQGTTANSCLSSTQSTHGSAIGTSVSVGGPAAGTPCEVTISGYVKTAGTSGTLRLQWAQDTSDATASIVKEGSWIRWVK